MCYTSPPNFGRNVNLVNAVEFRSALSLAAVYMSRMLGLFMVMPVLAVSAVSLEGFSPLLLGIAIGGYGLTQAILQIPMGILSDRYGRKLVIVAGLIMFGIGSLIASAADSMLWLIVGRLLQGTGAIAGAVMALAADTTRVEQRTKVMAIIGISIGLSFYVAIILGPLIGDKWGLSGLFGFSAITAILSILLVLFAVPSSSNIPTTSEALPNRSDVKALLGHPQLMRLNVSVALLHMLITVIFVLVPALLIALSEPLAEHWHTYGAVFAISLVLLGGLMAIARRIKIAVGIQFSIILILVAFVVLLVAPLSYVALFAALTLFFTGFNFLEARFPALVSTIAPAGVRGSAMGIYASFQFFGAFLGGVASGFVISWFSNEVLYTVIIVICIVWLFLFLRFHNGQSQTKRVTLTLNQSLVSADDVIEALSSLTGINDINVDIRNRVVHLKVVPEFDVTLAQNTLTKATN